MVLASIFVSLPFVVRETVPVLQEIGTDQEDGRLDPRCERLADLLEDHPAVDPLGRRLRHRPHHRAGARRVRRSDDRLRLDQRADPDPAAVREKQYANFNSTGAYGASLVLALLALITLFAMNLLKRKEDA